MRFDTINITKAEMEIMRLLWELNRPVTVIEVGQRLSHKHWKPSTIHTLTRRLESKGVIKYFKISGANYYVPFISEFEYNFMVTKDFIRALYNGSLINLVHIMLHDCDLSVGERSKLIELIKSFDVLVEASEETAQIEPNTKPFIKPKIQLLPKKPSWNRYINIYPYHFNTKHIERKNAVIKYYDSA